jgi:MFS transporter, BCD family, chlorophyll transporter
LVYSVEIVLLLAALIVLVPLVLRARREEQHAPAKFGLDQML